MVEHILKGFKWNKEAGYYNSFIYCKNEKLSEDIYLTFCNKMYKERGR